MRIDVLSLFPDMFSGVFGQSILKKAQEKNALEISVLDFRQFSTNKHRNVDDYPYGGGAGMVLTPQPLFDAVDTLTKDTSIKPRIILLCPQGDRFDQKKAEELAQEEHLIFLCGHYEGYDERVREYLVTDEISIGDYVLTGGELGAMVVIDAVSRLLPGVLGKEESHLQDSFSTGILEHPHYTRPADFRGMKVPDVLLSGNHKNIENWRKKESLKRTFERRPDLLEKIKLSADEEKMLKEIKEHKTT
ncbi:tRNA (guanosine(37)-N1)-methyltransferase TrmD [Fictibacillus barbaricus]|uniref:tRNA (guanine-N(1)-)-methyltransferase n=1 Tax=Fictibacillus barbaricus TaxID=182136 RepID=A0ABS2ZGJ3_9BACL|nr:tRNA (guanosine(37)-N1)-methyltransferase TrmD [Fictibacillus barbaricus]MBN3545870.1 tRNA (guanosine(37)-N1)-methyltransferase TrmD [Fictibacillus barbaricus]GGB56762.1 tRNA (guanine-N(1)-)-methyltransferase [Fictibacillus barbaricus]